MRLQTSGPEADVREIERQYAKDRDLLHGPPPFIRAHLSKRVDEASVFLEVELTTLLVREQYAGEALSSRVRSEPTQLAHEGCKWDTGWIYRWTQQRVRAGHRTAEA